MSASPPPPYPRAHAKRARVACVACQQKKQRVSGTIRVNWLTFVVLTLVASAMAGPLHVETALKGREVSAERYLADARG